MNKIVLQADMKPLSHKLMVLSRWEKKNPVVVFRRKGRAEVLRPLGSALQGTSPEKVGHGSLCQVQPLSLLPGLLCVHSFSGSLPFPPATPTRAGPIGLSDLLLEPQSCEPLKPLHFIHFFQVFIVELIFLNGITGLLK